jgi:hypothetical protein
VSSDRGAHFSALLHFCDLGASRCPSGSTVGVECSPLLASGYIASVLETCSATGGATSSQPVGEGGANAVGAGAGGAASGLSGTGGTPRETVDGSDGDRVSGSDSDRARARTRITRGGCGCRTAASAASRPVSTNLLAVLAAGLVGLRGPRSLRRRFRPRQTGSSSSR